MIESRPPQQYDSANDLPGAPGTLSTNVDWPSGAIRVTAVGFWAPDQASDHFAHYASCVRRIHQDGLPARVMIDFRQGVAQANSMIEGVSKGIEGLYRAGDRIAILEGGSILKMQLKRLLASEEYKFFTDELEAESWLRS